MATIAPVGRYYVYDDNGEPLNGGKIHTYEAGTTTPKVTYTAQDEGVANTNPVILDADGGADIWLGDGGYKFIVTDSADVEQFTTDNLGGGLSSAFGGNVNTITANTPITSLYANSVNIVTTAVTLSLLSAVTANEGYYFTVQNNSGGDVIIDPDGVETINGASTYTLSDGDSGLVICNGTTWYVVLNAKKTGTLATQDADSVAITGGTITGITDLAITDGGTGASDASTARANLDVLSSSEVASQVSDVVRLGSDTTLSGTSVSFSIPSGAKQIAVSWSNLSTNGTQVPKVQLGDSGGVETTGYLGTSAVYLNASVNLSDGFKLSTVWAASNVSHGQIILTLVNDSTNTWTAMLDQSFSSSASGGRCTGSKSLSAELSTVTITMDGVDTFDGGVINYVVLV